MAAERKAKSHSIGFGRSLTVKLMLGPDEEQSMPIQVRALYVDAKLKEFVTGEAHEVTDRLFVARRAFRLNNNLPGDDGKRPSWIWQRGGWLLVDRLTGHVSRLPLADFDPYYSQASWFRDYVAYCGLSGDGQKMSAVVMELGRRKPLLKKALGAASPGGMPAADCDAPRWQKNPVRVTFQPKNGQPASFTIFGHSWGAALGSDD